MRNRYNQLYIYVFRLVTMWVFAYSHIYTYIYKMGWVNLFFFLFFFWWLHSSVRSVGDHLEEKEYRDAILSARKLETLSGTAGCQSKRVGWDLWSLRRCLVWLIVMATLCLYSWSHRSSDSTPRPTSNLLRIKGVSGNRTLYGTYTNRRIQSCFSDNFCDHIPNNIWQPNPSGCNIPWLLSVGHNWARDQQTFL